MSTHRPSAGAVIGESSRSPVINSKLSTPSESSTPPISTSTAKIGSALRRCEHGDLDVADRHRITDVGRLDRSALIRELQEEDAPGEQDRQADADREQQQRARLHRRWSLRERFGNVGRTPLHSPMGLATFTCVITRLRHRTPLVAAVMAFGLLAAACGSDADSASTVPPAASQPDSHDGRRRPSTAPPLTPTSPDGDSPTAHGHCGGGARGAAVHRSPRGRRRVHRRRLRRQADGVLVLGPHLKHLQP